MATKLTGIAYANTYVRAASDVPSVGRTHAQLAICAEHSATVREVLNDLKLHRATVRALEASSGSEFMPTYVEDQTKLAAWNARKAAHWAFLAHPELRPAHA